MRKKLNVRMQQASMWGRADRDVGAPDYGESFPAAERGLARNEDHGLLRRVSEAPSRGVRQI